ncbi:MAG: methyltransferase domain-containing protein [Hyphomicrobiales bacterium]|nr:methyltransferase domain-containing protein [Hyphomicrobiales bacterium]
MKTPYKYIPIISDVYRFLRRCANIIRYRGSNVFCPVCGRSWGGWLKNSGCPFCYSQTRHKAIVLWLDENISGQEGQFRTLLFAPDFGVERWLRSHSKFDLLTTDYSAPRVDYHWDICELPASDKSFDIIICSHVMEHVLDDAKGFSEISRVLKKGGVLLLQVPYARDTCLTDEDDGVVNPKERERRFGQFDHVRMYGKDITDRISAAGLHCDVITLADWMSQDKMDLYGLWNDVLFVCRRAY